MVRQMVRQRTIETAGRTQLPPPIAGETRYDPDFFDVSSEPEKRPSKLSRIPLGQKARIFLAAVTLSSAAYINYGPVSEAKLKPPVVAEVVDPNFSIDLTVGPKGRQFAFPFRLMIRETNEKMPLQVFDGPDVMGSVVVASFINLDTGEYIPKATLDSNLVDANGNPDNTQILMGIESAVEAGKLAAGPISLRLEGNGYSEPALDKLPTDFTISGQNVSEIPKP